MQCAPQRRPGEKVRSRMDPCSSSLGIPVLRARIWELLRSYSITRVHRDPLGQHFPKHRWGQCSSKGFVLSRRGVKQNQACWFAATFLRALKYECTSWLSKGICSISCSPNVLDHGSLFSECFTGTHSGKYIYRSAHWGPGRDGDLLRSHGKLMAISDLSENEWLFNTNPSHVCGTL